MLLTPAHLLPILNACVPKHHHNGGDNSALISAVSGEPVPEHEPEPEPEPEPEHKLWP